MRILTIGVVLATLTILTAGCGSPPTGRVAEAVEAAPPPKTPAKAPELSEFQFRNRSGGEMIYVADLGPLKDPPPCGFLAGGADSIMRPQPIPRELVVTWRSASKDETTDPRSPDHDWKETKVAISNYEKFESQEVLLIVYLGEGRWNAKFMENQ